MKFIKWKSLILTSLICLLPILSGMALWDKLPDSVAIHFNIYSEPDGFAPKSFAVFGIPAMMLFFQIISAVTVDYSLFKHGGEGKYENAVKWILPIITIILHTITLGYSLGLNIDMKNVASSLAGLVLIVIGIFQQRLKYVKNYSCTEEKARKINKFIGIGMILMGILMFITILLPPIAFAFWFILLILFASIISLYTFITLRKK